MSEPTGWRPLSPARRATGADAFVVSPFTKLARVHALSVATDALVTVSLAGSLFFSIPTGAARGKVALYLALTMAPFAVVSPLIGPAIDRIRGGRRLMVLITCGLKAGTALFMIGHINDLLLFPAAFCFLVVGKGYQIAKSALVPTVVEHEGDLVRANSRLSLISALASVVVGGPGAGLVKLIGPEVALFLAVVSGTTAAVLALRLAPAVVAPEPADQVEESELRGAGILLAAEAMGLLRGMVGFLTFLLAFDLRGGGNDGPIPVGLALGRAVRKSAGFQMVGSGHPPTAPAWHFGAVLIAASLGTLLGAIVAPRLRQVFTEERILLGMLIGSTVLSLAAALQGGVGGAMLAAVTTGIAAAGGRLAFDSIVQRDAPDANFGRSFARFETRFQLVWVIGAFIPVIVPIPARFGFLIVALAAGFAAFAYYAGERRVAHHGHAPPVGSTANALS